MRRLFIKTAVVSAVVVAFSACGGGGSSEDFSSIESSTQGVLNGGSDYTTELDSLDMQRSSEDLVLTWKKNSTGYSELAYDYKDDTRGKTIITANATGVYSAYCSKLRANEYELTFKCSVSNLYGSDRYLVFEKGKEYKFFTNYGTELTRGEVQKTLTYLGNGEYTIE